MLVCQPAAGPLAPGLASRRNGAAPLALRSSLPRVLSAATLRGALRSGSGGRRLGGRGCTVVPRAQQHDEREQQQHNRPEPQPIDSSGNDAAHTTSSSSSSSSSSSTEGQLDSHPSSSVWQSAAAAAAAAARAAGCAAAASSPHSQPPTRARRFGQLVAKASAALSLALATAALQARPAHAGQPPQQPQCAAESRVLSNEQASTSGSSSSSGRRGWQLWRRNAVADVADDAKGGANSATAGVDVNEVYVGPGAAGVTTAYDKGEVKRGGGSGGFGFGGGGGKRAAAAALPAPKDMERIIRTDPDLQALISRKKAEHYRRTRQAVGSDKVGGGAAQPD
jgi:hypothetical protein